MQAIVAQLERILAQRQQLVQLLEGSAASRPDAARQEALQRQLAQISARQSLILDALSTLVPSAGAGARQAPAQLSPLHR